MGDWVLAETVIWASFFSKPNSPEKRALDDLIDADRVVLIGPILAEVLLGFRRTAQADWVASRLRSAHFFETSWDDWKSASEIGRELAAKGIEYQSRTWLPRRSQCGLTRRFTRPIPTLISFATCRDIDRALNHSVRDN